MMRDYTTHVRELAGLALSAAPGAPRRDDAVANAPEPVQRSAEPPPPPAAGGDGLTPAAIQAMLDRHNGMIEATWRALGLRNRHVLVRLVAKHQLEIRRRPRV